MPETTSRAPDPDTAFAGRKVLVTGAGGFIGSHLVEALARLGAEVTAMVRYGSDGNTVFVEV